MKRKLNDKYEGEVNKENNECRGEGIRRDKEEERG